MHNELGPALLFPDGYAAYAWHGVHVGESIIEAPQEITVETIESEWNAEVRRVMLERFGWQRYMQEVHKKLHVEPGIGELYRKNLLHDEPLVMVKVINRSPEPDGSRKFYMLRVPPEMKTVREAIAWTFGLSEAEYYPDVETW